jgi:thiamine biosynthesis lipoprotein
MRREQFRAMGTTISLLLPDHRANVGADAVRSLFAQWEQTLSRFRPESELSELNTQAGRPVSVSALLYEVVEVALAAARATDGLFDPTLLRQLVVAGYDRSFETLPHRLPRALTVPGPGGAWREIQLDPASRQVTLPLGSGLDLGGIAKGMAVDAALERLQDLDIDAALVNAGGDLAAFGRPVEHSDWPIAVPTRNGSYTVALRHGAVATSGIARRRWRQGPEQRHHLLDPRTGRSAHGLWSVSVGAAMCVQAEVGAKVACILGPEAGARFLTDNGLCGLLVHQGGTCETAGGWPAPADGECV